MLLSQLFFKMSDNIDYNNSNIIPTDVIDVKDDHYIFKTSFGEIYKMPTGTIPLEHNQLIAVGTNTYLQLQLLDNDTNENSNEEPIICASSSRSPVQSPEFVLTTDAEKKSCAEWSDNTTKLLIQQYRELKPLVEDRKIKTMKRMWEIINAKFKEHGLEFYTTQQIESKWKTLERAFKAAIGNSKKTGRGKRSCPYERELAEILLKRASVIPPCVLDEKSEKSRDNLLEESGLHDIDLNENTNDADDLSRSSTPRSNERNIRPRNQELKLLAEAIEARTLSKREIENRKLEQRERLIRAIQERNELLRNLLAKNNQI